MLLLEGEPGAEGAGERGGADAEKELEEDGNAMGSKGGRREEEAFAVICTRQE